MEKDLLLNQTEISRLLDIDVNKVHRFIKKHDTPNAAESVKSKYYSHQAVRKICSKIYSAGIIPTNKIQAFYNFKGGTGKTSLCYQTACFFSNIGFNVLVRDADHQANLSECLGIHDISNVCSLYDILIDKIPINRSVIKIRDGLDLIPANEMMFELDYKLSKQDKYDLMTESFNNIKDHYDLIFIDPNPAISRINLNILHAADIVNLIISAEAFSTSNINRLINIMKKYGSNNYRFIINYFQNAASAQKTVDFFRDKHSDKLVDAVIRKSETFNTSVREQRPIATLQNKKNINAFFDIRDLCKEMLKCDFLKDEALAA